ncbi:hypothetical protein [Anaerotignum sp.]|uniref:hypothetical protein n=1 Tax=Anaerotignum sp. TaxID=2039241 RepID=UPI002899B23F|nr:hypothetical protein [Anaerotignum sp.]
MGSGKTSWSVNYINENYGNNILYITPFLDEVERIIDSCNRDFKQPINKGQGKLFSLNELLMCEEDIASTHELFKHLDEESKQYIKDGHYTLILDEVLNVIEPYNIKKDDLRILIDSKCISIDEDGFVMWNQDKKNYDVSFNELKRLAENKSLISVNGIVLLWRYPPEVFELFDKVYVLTYLFEASILSNYFNLYRIQYTKKSICSEDERYKICDYYYANPTTIKEKINIYQGKLNENFHQKENGLSSTWFMARHNAEYIKQIRKNIYNYFTNIVGAKSETILWTTFKKQQQKLKGKGYTKQFLACNCRSTNEYADTYNLAYAINIYIHPVISQFFNQKGIYINQDLYALSEMIQWVWRSRIRKGENINIYVPSIRMRELLMEWLDGRNVLDKIKFVDSQKVS